MAGTGRSCLCPYPNFLFLWHMLHHLHLPKFCGTCHHLFPPSFGTFLHGGRRGHVLCGSLQGRDRHEHGVSGRQTWRTPWLPTSIFNKRGQRQHEKKQWRGSILGVVRTLPLSSLHNTSITRAFSAPSAPHSLHTSLRYATPPPTSHAGSPRAERGVSSGPQWARALRRHRRAWWRGEGLDSMKVKVETLSLCTMMSLHARLRPVFHFAAGILHPRHLHLSGRLLSARCL